MLSYETLTDSNVQNVNKIKLLQVLEIKNDKKSRETFK